MSGPIARGILRETAADHGLAVAVMLEKSRSPDRVAARFDAMRRLRSITRMDGRPRFSLPQIGAMLGMHHTTVLNGLRRMEVLAPVPHPQHSSRPHTPLLSSSPHLLRGSGNADDAEFSLALTTIPCPRNKSGGDEGGACVTDKIENDGARMRARPDGQ